MTLKILFLSKAWTVDTVVHCSSCEMSSQSLHGHHDLINNRFFLLTPTHRLDCDVGSILILPSKTSWTSTLKDISAKERKHLWEETGVWEHLHKHKEKDINSTQQSLLSAVKVTVCSVNFPPGHKTITHLADWSPYSMKRLLSFPPAPQGRLLPFLCLRCLDCGPVGVDIRKKWILTEGSFWLPLSTRGCQRILHLGKQRHGDGELLLILSYWLCLCQRSRKSFGQIGLLLTSPLQWTRLFDLHIVKSSVYFMGDERRMFMISILLQHLCFIRQNVVLLSFISFHMSLFGSNYGWPKEQQHLINL